MVFRKVQEFSQGADGRFTALLFCGHRTRIDHTAPPPAADWSRTEHGRKNLIGSLLRCPECERGVEPSVHDHSVSKFEHHSSRFSFWRRPKRPRSHAKPTWIDAGFACGRVDHVDDLRQLVRLGFRTVLCLSQAGEPGQVWSPLRESAWARALGLTALWYPVAADPIDDTALDGFIRALDKAPRPVLVHSNGDPRPYVFLALRAAALRSSTTIACEPLQPQRRPALRLIESQAAKPARKHTTSRPAVLGRAVRSATSA